MAFADRLAFARKQKKIKQSNLGKTIGTSGDIIGKYERGEAIPSVDVAKKIADALGVSLDYLVGGTNQVSFDKRTVERIKDLEQLEESKKQTLYDLIDIYIRDYRLAKSMTLRSGGILFYRLLIVSTNSSYELSFSSSINLPVSYSSIITLYLWALS
ncbi:helix-turn-helix domain-containing protein [Chryseobacterium paludis]|uniref:helix-turn-helix domain-containing protein n=1 Tax=Chryseobacterium paludis TaxID=2956784 RepID=UPI0021C0FC04|nr:helix-turn-helix transcriptional regulator [Chryseobacterium paludis]